MERAFSEIPFGNFGQKIPFSPRKFPFGETKLIFPFTFRPKFPGFFGVSSTQSNSEGSEPLHSFRFRLRLRRLKTHGLVGVGGTSGRTNQSQGPESNIVIGLFFRFSLRLRQSIFLFFTADRECLVTKHQ